MEVLSFAIGMNLEGTVLSKLKKVKLVKERQILYDVTHMWNLKM